MENNWKKEAFLVAIAFVCLFVLLKVSATLKENVLDITSLVATLITYEVMKKSIKTLIK